MPMIKHEATIRLICFTVMFFLISVWEKQSPRRKLSTIKRKRWSVNLSMAVLNQLVVHLLFPVLAVSMAAKSQVNEWGILNNINLHSPIKCIIAVILLDFTIYLQHVMFHAIPALWRLHMVHHADLDLDATTGLRFHPIEIIVSMIIKFAAITIIGASPLAVLLFEVLLNAIAMFNHGNIYLTRNIDNVLRFFVVTPDMHRVHHSVIIKETNSNFSFNLPWWDMLLGTYQAQPRRSHANMNLGLAQLRQEKKQTLLYLLQLPFSGDIGRQSINKH